MSGNQLHQAKQYVKQYFAIHDDPVYLDDLADGSDFGIIVIRNAVWELIDEGQLWITSNKHIAPTLKLDKAIRPRYEDKSR